MRADDEARMPVVAPIRLRNCLWVPMLGGAWLAAAIFGTPHLRTDYRWNGSERAPVYFACIYWGLTSFRIVPDDGACPLIVLARSKRGG